MTAVAENIFEVKLSIRHNRITLGGFVAGGYRILYNAQKGFDTKHFVAFNFFRVKQSFVLFILFVRGGVFLVFATSWVALFF